MTAGRKQARHISWAEFEGFFDEFEYSAFRLETLQTYSAEHEEREFADFLAGTHDLSPDIGEWGEEVSSGIARGRRYDRVHVVTEPLSDYVRFECVTGYRQSVLAGENIRILPVPEGQWPSGLPRLDYWLFDSHVLVHMDYGLDGSLISPVVIGDPRQIVAANAWRDRAMHLSLPFAEYDARFNDAMYPLETASP
ncbi:DUF6879 family protein [Nocardiopsis sediminis]|uniref:DUF6879 family protein n=1 Tax=Nocardiopsis sediminis TaxID=1778267 RepID=A0ABV8FP47_9ACTN